MEFFALDNLVTLAMLTLLQAMVRRLGIGLAMVLVLTDIVQGRYRKKLMAQRQQEHA